MKACFRQWLVFGALVLVLSGCIVVDDFGSYWNKGFIDNCVNSIVNANHDDDRRHNTQPKPMLLRSLRVGSHTFLMMRDDMASKGGNIMLYKIVDGDYISYRLNESKREDFSRDYPNSMVVLTSETASIPVLNNESIALLSQVADNESYWVESHRETYNPARRADCIQTLY